MRTGLKQRLSAWLLLAVFLPMLMLSALHTHAVAPTSADACVECVHHQPHAGHLTASTVTLSDCVLCQFFSLQYLEAAAVTLIVAVSLVVMSSLAVVQGCPSRPLTLHTSRAPPYLVF